MLASTRRQAPGPFELWSVDLDQRPDADELESLSSEERARAGRFAFERDRQRYVVAHCALRQRLSERTGVDAQCLNIVTTDDGKPVLAGDAVCSFNLSHSQHLAAIVLAESGDIGIDIEWITSLPDVHALAEQHFAPTERRCLAAEAPERRDAAFLLGWTRKEACLKALGCGLQVSTDCVDVGLTMDLRRTRVITTTGVAVVEVQSLQWTGEVVCSLARVVPA